MDKFADASVQRADRRLDRGRLLPVRFWLENRESRRSANDTINGRSSAALLLEIL